MTEAGMRSTENVRGEWDELGERDTRVIVPGPGAGDAQGEPPARGLPVAPVHEAGVPGPGAEPEPARERPAGTGVADAPREEEAVPVETADPVTGSPRAADLPAVEVEDIPADLGPALDAVAVVGRPAAAATGVIPVDLDLDLPPDREQGLDRDLDTSPDREPLDWEPLGQEPVCDLESLEPEPLDPEAPDPGPPAGPGPVWGPPSLPEEVPGAVDTRSGPGGPLGLRKPEPDGTVVPDGTIGPDVTVVPDVSVVPDEEGASEGPVASGGARISDEAGAVDAALVPDGPGAPGGARVLDGSGVSGGAERAPVRLTVGAADPVAWWGAGRRQPVISTETTAPIPVHLLFRDDDHDGTPAGEGGTAAGAGTARVPAFRRPPLPRHPQAQPPTRSAPPADPRLVERPGPVLSGWAALFTAATGAAAGLAVLWWQGAVPTAVTARLGLGARPYDGIGTGVWALLALLTAVALFALCGLGRGRAGHASVLTLFGEYRGSVRRTGLLWISPLLLRRRVDVRLRHWRSEPLPAVDASGTALRAVVLVVWRVKDTARALFGVADHERYLSDQVEAALARVLSQLPADAFHEDTRTLRDAEAVGDALTRMVKADCAPVGIEVYSAQPTGIEYAPEVAAAMQRRRVAAIDAKHRDGVLTSVVDAVDDTVRRLTARGIVELDGYEHKALVRDLTVAFYTGRGGGEGA
ncbi:SPFH domain-containing protein [Streptomyces sp. SM10]|uniref:SPFH domain-containing protein n=1 Tax=Streptomyces sp. SM10 TaxID=565556 RepID=UPI002156279D|nr:SPFH domain-containing protein [Streptomyces sp. SM10]